VIQSQTGRRQATAIGVLSGPDRLGRLRLIWGRMASPSSSGPMSGQGQGDGVSVYFRDPDGSLREFISYAP